MASMRGALPSWVVIALVIGGASCSSRPKLSDCAFDSDCAQGEVCVSGQCSRRAGVDAALFGGGHHGDSGSQPEADASATNDDAGTIVPPDASTSSFPDAMPVSDADTADSMPAADSGIAKVFDAGCPNQVVVEGVNAFCSIAAALAAAPPNSIIDVGAATYNESLTINTSLTMRGAISNGMPASTIAPASGQVGVLINAQSVTLQHFTFIPATGDIPAVDVAGAALVQDVTIDNGVGVGITVEGTATIDNARISHIVAASGGTNPFPGIGIYCDSQTTTPAHCTITNSMISSTDSSALFAYGAVMSVQMTGVTAAGTRTCAANVNNCAPGIAGQMNAQVSAMMTTVTYSGIGFYTDSGSTLSVMNSNASNNGARSDWGGDGAYLYNSQNATIINSVFQNNMHDGIYCDTNSGVQSCGGNTYTNNSAGRSNCNGC
jgi:hypothetical protein